MSKIIFVSHAKPLSAVFSFVFVQGTAAASCQCWTIIGYMGKFSFIAACTPCSRTWAHGVIAWDAIPDSSASMQKATTSTPRSDVMSQKSKPLYPGSRSCEIGVRYVGPQLLQTLSQFQIKLTVTSGKLRSYWHQTLQSFIKLCCNLTFCFDELYFHQPYLVQVPRESNAILSIHH